MFFTAIAFGQAEVAQYLLHADEDIHDGTPKLLFHRIDSMNILHIAVYGCKTSNAYNFLQFLLKYALKHGALSMLLNEVVVKDVGTVLDHAFTHFIACFGHSYKLGTELWYRVEAIKLLQSYPNITTTFQNNCNVDNLNTVKVTNTLNDGTCETVTHLQYVNKNDEGGVYGNERIIV